MTPPDPRGKHLKKKRQRPTPGANRENSADHPSKPNALQVAGMLLACALAGIPAFIFTCTGIYKWGFPFGIDFGSLDVVAWSGGSVAVGAAVAYSFWRLLRWLTSDSETNG